MLLHRGLQCPYRLVRLRIPDSQSGDPGSNPGGDARILADVAIHAIELAKRTTVHHSGALTSCGPVWSGRLVGIQEIAGSNPASSIHHAERPRLGPDVITGLRFESVCVVRKRSSTEERPPVMRSMRVRILSFAPVRCFVGPVWSGRRVVSAESTGSNPVRSVCTGSLKSSYGECRCSSVGRRPVSVAGGRRFESCRRRDLQCPSSNLGMRSAVYRARRVRFSSGASRRGPSHPTRAHNPGNAGANPVSAISLAL